MNKITAGMRKERVVLIIDGKTVLDLHWKHYNDVIRVIKQAAAQAEEYENANQVIDHQAVMMRAGMPLGLSDNPAILKAARQKALYDKQLRAYIPSVKHLPVVGTPRLKQYKPGQISPLRLRGRNDESTN